MKALVINKKATHNYEILDKFEAGLVLEGHEVKAIKTGKMSIRGAYVTNSGDELYLTNATISPYQPKNTPEDYNPTRQRTLLLHNKEVRSVLGKLKEKGLTLMPLKVYNSNNRLKLSFGLARGKKKHDKREAQKTKEFKREKHRLLKFM